MYNKQNQHDGSDVFIVLQMDEAEIIIRVQGEVLFDTTSDVIKQQGYETIDYIITEVVLKAIAEDQISFLVINGYADERQIPPGYRFKDNWELAAFRALAAFRYVQETFDIPYDKLSLGSHGESQPLDRIDGETDAEWWARNRRVEFVMKKNAMFDQESGQAMIKP
jgi:flagellar motor protein MotB